MLPLPQGFDKPFALNVKQGFNPYDFKLDFKSPLAPSTGKASLKQMSNG